MWAAVIIVVAVLAYTGAVVVGMIPSENRIDAVHLGVLALAAVAVALLVFPHLFDRLRTLEVKGVKIELREVLEKQLEVREKQLEQGKLLQFIDLLIPLVLPEELRRHLQNLAHGRAGAYKGTHALRSELRRLRAAGLIRMLRDKHVADIQDGQDVNLANYLELTDTGQQWAEQIDEAEKEKHLAPSTAP
jgi:hypothetical protein